MYDAREASSLRFLIFSFSERHGSRRAIEEPDPVRDAQDAGLDVVSAAEDGSVDALGVALFRPVPGVSRESEESGQDHAGGERRCRLGPRWLCWLPCCH